MLPAYTAIVTTQTLHTSVIMTSKLQFVGKPHMQFNVLCRLMPWAYASNACRNATSGAFEHVLACPLQYHCADSCCLMSGLGLRCTSL